jgi:hypothetical protein
MEQTLYCAFILSYVEPQRFRFPLMKSYGSSSGSGSISIPLFNVNEKNEGNQIHNFISSSDSGTVIYYGSGSDI